MANDLRTVLVLFGGRSAEHEISVLSARFIVQSLDPERFEPLLVGIDKQGRWRLQDAAQLPSGDDPREIAVVDEGQTAWIAPWPSTADRAGLHLADGSQRSFDVVFPVLHGPLGEDGCLQGLLELAGVAYVGAGVAGSAIGMDKVLQKRLLAEAELPVVPYWAFRGSDWQQRQTEQLEECERLGYPLFVKPANMGSSVGISKALDREQLLEAIAVAFELDNKVLVEQGLSGCREIECSVLGNERPRVSVAGEIKVAHADGFYSYDAKYVDAEGAELCIPADLYHAEQSAAQLLALKAFRVLDGAGMARVDMFMSPERDIYLNEVNTIPGFTAISMYPQLWQASGVSPTELVSTLIELASARHEQRTALRTSRS